MTTYSGKIVNPLNMKLEDICIEDIAHALSLVNRFGGHTFYPISVAQHSSYVRKLVQNEHPRVQLQALLHDGSEAYLGDMVKWVKATEPMRGYRALEETIQTLIYERFECPTILHPKVEWADRVMVRYESVKGYGRHIINHPDYPQLTIEEIDLVEPWWFQGPSEAKEDFLYSFDQLVKIIGGAE